MSVKDNPVNCDGCTACCVGEAIVLQPEDNPLLYRTVPFRHPVTGENVLRLPTRPGGACIYLGESGCTIHDKRPAICRAFSCVGFVRDRLTKAGKRERKELKATGGGYWAGDVWDAGMKRIGEGA